MPELTCCHASRDHFWRCTIALRSSSPTTWNSAVAACESHQATTRIWAESTHTVPAAISKCEVTAAAALAANIADRARRYRVPCRRTEGRSTAGTSGYGVAASRMPPHPADRGVGKASLCRHRADRPMRRVGRRRAQRRLDHGCNLIIIDRSGSGAKLRRGP